MLSLATINARCLRTKTASLRKLRRRGKQYFSGVRAVSAAPMKTVILTLLCLMG